jgi:hypothetical protein
MTYHTSEPEDVGRLLRRSGTLAPAIVEAADAASMIAIIRTHLRSYRSWFERPLRRFAWQCAHDVAAFSHGPTHEALLAAGRLVAALGPNSYLAAAHHAARSDAAAARAVGMARCEPSAAAFLAAYHSCAANVFDAAHDSAECAAKVAFFRAARVRSQHAPIYTPGEPWRESRQVAEWLKRHRDELADVDTDARRRQAELLRSILGLAAGRVLRFERQSLIANP